MNLKKTLKLCFSIFLLWFTIHTVYIFYDGLSDDGKSADVALVLGNTVNKDGTLSPRLKARLDCSLILFKDKRCKFILISGGLGKEGHFEGTVMRNYLLEKGIPDSCIIVDNKGNNTEASVINTLKIVKEKEFKSVLVVSQYFHVTRTKKLFRERNFQHVSSVAPSYFEWRDFYSVTREFFAYYLG